MVPVMIILGRLMNMEDAEVAAEVLQRPQESRLALLHVAAHGHVDSIVDQPRRRLTVAGLHEDGRRGKTEHPFELQ